MKEQLRLLPVALFLAGLAGLAGVPHHASGQVGLQEVTRLRFVGNEQFSDRELANAIVTRETECSSPLLFAFCWAGADFAQEPFYFSPREFGRDEARVRLFYYQRGYREAEVDTVLTRPVPDQVEITFRIREGEPVRVGELTFEGVEEVGDPSLVENLSLAGGDPLSLVAIDATRDTLLVRLKNRGYAHAEVLMGYDLSAGAYEAPVLFDVYPGPLARFGPLTVTGNASVSESVVRRMLPFRTGQLYSQDLRYVGLRNLYSLDIFSFADIIPDTTFVPDTIVPLTIRVAEGQVHRVRSGIGLSSADCLNAEARWASRNFLGGARRLQVTGRVSNVLAPQLEPTLCRSAGTGEYGLLNWLVSVDFSQPWLLSPRNSLGLSLFGERQSFPGLFVRQSLGLQGALTHTLTAATPLTFSVRPQLSSLEAAEVFFCTNYLVCTRADIGILQQANWLAPVAISLSRDRRDQVLSPTRGYSALVDLEHADDWTGSEFRYTRLIAEGTWYTRGESGWVVATRLRGGWVGPEGFRGLGRSDGGSGIVHPEKRLYAGGSNSVRGYAQNGLGPRVLQADVADLLRFEVQEGVALCTTDQILDLSCDASGLPDGEFLTRPLGGTSTLEGGLELRLPLRSRIWEGAAFLDFGQVWEEDTQVELGDLELTPGLGVRYFSPIGPIRVDVAYRFAGGRRLQVVTSQIRPYDDRVDKPEAMLKGPRGVELGYVASRELAILPEVLYGGLGTWSLQRFQLHLSIGQAF